MYTSWTFRIDVGKRAATVDGKAIFVRHVDLVTELKLNSVLSEKVCGTNFEIEAKDHAAKQNLQGGGWAAPAAGNRSGT